MNHYSLNDPQLQALEAQLAASAPLVSTARRQQLLYRCAFAAGQSAASSTLRRWQGAVAALTVLLLGMSIPLARGPSMLAKREVEPPARRELSSQGIPAEWENLPIARGAAVTVALDAWQMPPSATASFDDELAQYEQIDPRLRSLTLGALTRKMLE